MAGVQIYGLRKNGKFYGENIVKAKVELNDKSRFNKIRKHE